MVASITQIQPPLYFLLNESALIGYCLSKIFELCHISNTTICYLHIIILLCILMMRQQHELTFLCVYFQTNFLINVRSLCDFLYDIYVITNRFISR
jgi:hypothetical protein